MLTESSPELSHGGITDCSEFLVRGGAQWAAGPKFWNNLYNSVQNDPIIMVDGSFDAKFILEYNTIHFNS